MTVYLIFRMVSDLIGLGYVNNLSARLRHISHNKPLKFTTKDINLLIFVMPKILRCAHFHLLTQANI